eukprot:COSAG05_NODE_12161_length_480_cov_1.209974_1_plen_70_part_10
MQVAAIGQSCYLALDKGALVWEPCPHLLVIPIDHYGTQRPPLFARLPVAHAHTHAHTRTHTHTHITILPS